MGFYDRAVGEMKAAGEVLVGFFPALFCSVRLAGWLANVLQTWAQQYLAEEKKVVLERLLKG